jgi:minor extracellular serine protease Vpr
MGPDGVASNDGAKAAASGKLELGVGRAALGASGLASSTLALARDLSPVRVEAHFTPTVLDSRPVSVILQLARDPISVGRAKAGGLLPVSEEAALRAAILADQAALAARVKSLGGSVRFAFQNVYNALSVSVPRAALPALRADARVSTQHAARKVRRSLSHSVPYLGAPEVWQGSPGLQGQNVKVAVLDSGIDYTHADFGGPGTAAAYALARESSTLPADARYFGPDAPRIKGGIDFVGDEYDSDSDDPARNVPQPDANPLDCEGHGTHVAGIAGGSGVNLDGSSFAGPYDASTFEATFAIAPGVAPRADLYAVRVFGCEGSVDSDVVVAAIEWAAEHDIDVINMSFSAPFGNTDSPEAAAAKNAIAAGVTIVGSAGNLGDIPYITGSPGSADGVISVAALDAVPSFSGASFVVQAEGPDVGATAEAFDVINANGANLEAGTVFPVVVLGTPGAVALGCSAEEYGPEVAGALVVTLRGSCSRVTRALLGQQAGAAAVAMINTDASLPPFDGSIEGVTIPFFGVSSTNAASLTAASTLTASPKDVANPSFRAVASFSSSGPRFGDSGLKPSVIAPGVSVVSAGSGTGTGRLVTSGTSMAAPAVAGLAALTRQAHPEWSPAEVAAAITSTADPALVRDPIVRRVGTGVPQAPSAARTAVTLTASEGGASALNFGFVELLEGFSGERSAAVYNGTDEALTFAVSVSSSGGVPHAAQVPSSISVAPGATNTLTLALDIDTAVEANPLDFEDVSGRVVLTPVSGVAGANPATATLRIPYYAVVRPVAALAVSAELPRPEAPLGNVTLSNTESALAATAELFDLGIRGEESPAGCNDIRAVGVRSVDAGDDRLLVFAINAFRRCSSPAPNEYALLITNEAGDVHPVIGVDEGLVATGDFSGSLVTLTIDPLTGEQTQLPAIAPTDSHDVFLFTFASSVGVTADNPRFTYSIEATNSITSESDTPSETGSFNAFQPALIGIGTSALVPPGGTAQLPLRLDLEESALAPSRGLLVTVLENAEALGQAQLFPFEAPSTQALPSLANRADQAERLRAELGGVFEARPVRAPVFLAE